jgi:membrane-bound ClpP family serine protease
VVQSVQKLGFWPTFLNVYSYRKDVAMFRVPIYLIGLGVLLLFTPNFVTVGVFQTVLLMIFGSLLIVGGIGAGVWIYVIRNEPGNLASGLQERATIVGKSGKAATPLSPSGFVMIDGQRWDAVTRGEYIDIGTEVEVVGVQSVNLVVQSREPFPQS